MIQPDPSQPKFIKVAGIGSAVLTATAAGFALGPVGAAIAGGGALLTGIVMWFAKPPQRRPRATRRGNARREMRDEGDDAV